MFAAFDVLAGKILGLCPHRADRTESRASEVPMAKKKAPSKKPTGGKKAEAAKAKTGKK